MHSGMLLLGEGDLDFHVIFDYIAVDNASFARGELLVNGVVVGSQTILHGGFGLQTGTFDFTVLDVPIESGDLAQVRMIEDGTGSPWTMPAGVGDANHRFEANGILTEEGEGGFLPWDAEWELWQWIWEAQKHVPRDGVIEVPYGGRGVNVTPAGLYNWRMWVVNEVGETSNIVGGVIELTLGWDPDPGLAL